MIRKVSSLLSAVVILMTSSASAQISEEGVAAVQIANEQSFFGVFVVYDRESRLSARIGEDVISGFKEQLKEKYLGFELVEIGSRAEGIAQTLAGKAQISVLTGIFCYTENEKVCTDIHEDLNFLGQNQRFFINNVEQR